MRLNLNETIKVKLTDLGEDIYYHQYDRINAFAGREVCKPSYPKVDDDGYTEFQLWCFMELYGEHMGMAHQNVIYPIEIVFDAPTIDPVRKGKWIKAQGMMPPEMFGVYYCSLCDGKAMRDYKSHKQILTDWCPHCGAKMEEGEE